MSEGILIALIGAAATVCAQLVISRRTQTQTHRQHEETITKIQQQQDKATALMEHRLGQVEKKMDMMTNLSERVGILENTTRNIQNQIENIERKTV